MDYAAGLQEALGDGLVSVVLFHSVARGEATVCKIGDCVTQNGTRDGSFKRLHYNYVALFYDMTPNIRWGFEWGMHGTNRRRLPLLLVPSTTRPDAR